MKTDLELQKELSSRGLIHQVTQNIPLDSEVVAYAGFDPTADSLHVGNLTPIMLLINILKTGGKVVALVGGATGRIGDPSGKSSERNMLDSDVLDLNIKSITKQLTDIISGYNNSINGDSEKFSLVNNLDWAEKINMIDFLRDYGKHFTVNNMMSKDSVKNRIGGDGATGMSFTEFSYQIIQSMDFKILNETMGCNVQVGGSDQWGNMTGGMDLIRRKNSNPVGVITCPLITKSDGTKFGKSEGGNVWLDPNKTTPFDFYQFWINQSDEDAKKFIGIYTLLPMDEVRVLIATHFQEPHKRVLQNRLAEEVTKLVHGEELLEEAKLTTSILHGKSKSSQIKTQVANMNEETLLRVFKSVKVVTVENFDQPMGELLTSDKELFESKGVMNRLIKGGGLSINFNKIQKNNDTFIPILGKYLIIQKGKKNFTLVKKVSK